MKGQNRQKRFIREGARRPRHEEKLRGWRKIPGVKDIQSAKREKELSRRGVGHEGIREEPRQTEKIYPRRGTKDHEVTRRKTKRMVPGRQPGGSSRAANAAPALSRGRKPMEPSSSTSEPRRRRQHVAPAVSRAQAIENPRTLKLGSVVGKRFLRNDPRASARGFQWSREGGGST